MLSGLGQRGCVYPLLPVRLVTGRIWEKFISCTLWFLQIKCNADQLKTKNPETSSFSRAGVLSSQAGRETMKGDTEGKESWHFPRPGCVF